MRTLKKRFHACMERWDEWRKTSNFGCGIWIFTKRRFTLFSVHPLNTPLLPRTQRRPATARCLRFNKFPLSNANAGFWPGPPLIGLPDI
ncbi:hypothetical protein CEXT_668771 [Caerostris extrusa]|uniref:Uncharacterized protein n=1 Tax=Caerostris extrusa TaxID=172846 RepID=A0AAV4XBI0_CAEEX|nr:hypothetical protein CEXT_668771 [Caerostris extrusa]